MRYWKKLVAAGFLGVASLFSNYGCAPKTQHGVFVEVMKKDCKATEAEAQVAFVHGFRKAHGQRIEEGGKYHWKPDYDSVSIEDRISVISKMKSDLESLLGFSEPENVKLVDSFAIRDVLEKRIAAVNYNLGRLELARLYKDFKSAMQESQSFDETDPVGLMMSMIGITAPKSQFGNQISELDLLVPDGSLEKKCVFEAPYVEEAKKSGKLQAVEGYGIEHIAPIKSKDAAGNDVWSTKMVSLKIVGYDIGDNTEKKVGYIEVYRSGADGKPESSPAMKIFHPIDGTVLSVALIDSDPSGIEGNGVFDRLEKINVDSIKSLVKDNEALLLDLYKGQSRCRPARPSEPPMDVQISRVGEQVIGEKDWEYSRAGWSVPSGFEQRSDSYTLAVCYKTVKDESKDGKGESRLEKKAAKDSHLGKEIRYIAKEYRMPSSAKGGVDHRFVEYYRVKGEYKDVLDVKVEGHRLTIDHSDGSSETSLDMKVLEPTPFAKAYDAGPGIRFIVYDKDGKDAKYELRKKIAPAPTSLELDKDKGEL